MNLMLAEREETRRELRRGRLVLLRVRMAWLLRRGDRVAAVPCAG